MRKKVLVPIADGVEEMEAVCIIDVLRRAGAQVTVASVGPLQVTASRGVKLVADKRLSECRDETFDMIALPGGMPGAEHLRDSDPLKSMLENQHAQGRFFGAICAAPAVVLQQHGLLENRRATCHPAFSDQLKDAEKVEARVVVDGNLVTSRAPGTAIEFALKLAALLFDEERARKVAAPMLVE